MTEPSTEPTPHEPRRQNALADIQFASILDSDLTPSEDETAEEQALELETVQSAIGVSIGRQQTHLTSPKTPAVEKAAAIDDNDGGMPFAEEEYTRDIQATQAAPQLGPIDGQSDYISSPGREPVEDSTTIRLPSPWRAGPRKLRIEDREHRTTLRETFKHSRRRALSGGFTADSLKKYMNFNLPSMPKTPNILNFSLPSFPIASLDYASGRSGQRKRVTSMYSESGDAGTAQHDGSVPSSGGYSTSSPTSGAFSPPRHVFTAPIPQREFARPSLQSPDLNTDSLGHDIQRRPTPVLRKSNSEGSLLLYRQRSFASSLGDDTRFENVQEQVNSRLKALKDSWQDANFKLPSLPNMSNFGFGSREDMFRLNRNETSALRGSGSGFLTPNYRVSFLANSTSKDGPTKLPRAKASSTNIAGTASVATNHPFFTQALKDLRGDVVILGGYRGSILRSAEPPNRQLWVPIKVGLNLRKVDLEVGLNPEDEETEERRIIPGGMLTHIGPVDIGRRLLKRLRNCDNAKRGDLKVHNYGYDWRLSPHLLSRKLAEFLKKLPCNQPGVPPEKRGAVVIAHSLGGLITRHVINKHPELVAGVVYAGVPQTCVNILGPLRNGDDVLLSSRVLTAQVNFTIRTSYALLPLDGKCFINKQTKEEYPIDFFDINTWIEYRLSPCIAPPLPHPNTAPNLLSASGLFSAVSQALPSMPGRKSSLITSKSSSNLLHQKPTPSPPSHRHHDQGTEPHTNPLHDAADVARNAASQAASSSAQNNGMTPSMQHPTHKSPDQSNPATAVTIPYEKAVEYLARTLSEVKRFKQELAHNPAHSAADRYPPIALIYGKSTPTVYGAKVESREAIKRADAYDELAFASGDGVVLARAAMVPPGYEVVRGGVVSSDRGHVTLLGDLEAVGRCLVAVLGARGRGVGLGRKKDGNGREQVDGLGIDKGE